MLKTHILHGQICIIELYVDDYGGYDSKQSSEGFVSTFSLQPYPTSNWFVEILWAEQTNPTWSLHKDGEKASILIENENITWSNVSCLREVVEITDMQRC